MKFCKDCAHFERNIQGMLCRSPMLIHDDMVEGRVQPKMFPGLCRANEITCGKQAVWFSPVHRGEAIIPPSRMVDRLARWFMGLGK